jgi:hypothetical protein
VRPSCMSPELNYHRCISESQCGKLHDMLPETETRNGEQGALKSHRPIYNPHQAPIEEAIRLWVLDFTRCKLSGVCIS